MAEQMQALSGVPVRIPRYIANLNALAIDAGLAVEMAAEPYGNDPQIRLWSNWRGTSAAFLALVQPVASYHLPLSCGRLNIPGGSGYYAHNALITGTVTVTGNDVLFEIDFGPAKFTIADAADVEMVSYEHESLYHGSPAAILALGIERTRLPLGKKPCRSWRGWNATEHWSSRRQPDGTIVYRVETPASLRRRCAEVDERYVGQVPRFTPERMPQGKPRPSHLRLIIDNT